MIGGLSGQHPAPGSHSPDGIGSEGPAQLHEDGVTAPFTPVGQTGAAHELLAAHHAAGGVEEDGEDSAVLGAEASRRSGERGYGQRRFVDVGHPSDGMTGRFRARSGSVNGV